MRRKSKYLSEPNKQQRHLLAAGLRRLEEVEKREGAKRCETISDWKALFASMAERGTRYSEKSQQRIMEGRIKPDGPSVSDDLPTPAEPEPVTVSPWAKLLLFFDSRWIRR